LCFFAFPFEYSLYLLLFEQLFRENCKIRYLRTKSTEFLFDSVNLRHYTPVARFSSDAVFVPRLSPLVVISGVYPFLDHLARWAFLPVFLSIKEV
jgi:hypothetical protein